jgi:hypothetical protein
MGKSRNKYRKEKKEKKLKEEEEELKRIDLREAEARLKALALRTPAAMAGSSPQQVEFDLSMDELLDIFPNGIGKVSTTMMWLELGSPIGKEALLQVAKAPLPPKYADQKAAIAAGARPGARSAHLLARAAVACVANKKNFKPESKLKRLEEEFNPHLDEFFKLCQLKRP